MILIARGGKGELLRGGGGLAKFKLTVHRMPGSWTAHSTQTIVAIRESKQNTAFPEESQSKTLFCQNVLKAKTSIFQSCFS